MSANPYATLAARHAGTDLGALFARLAAQGAPQATPRTVVTGRTAVCQDVWRAAQWIMLVTQAKRTAARIRRWRRTGIPTDAP